MEAPLIRILLESRTILEKTYKVKMLDEGFEYNGTHFRSLSKIAREITGQIWNGFLFIGIINRTKKLSA